MKSKKSLAVSLVFFLGISLCLWAKEDLFQKKKPKETEIKSLIREELFLKERKKLWPPRRIIFSPRNPGEIVTSLEENRMEQSPEENAPVSGEERPLPSLNIRYIGYIHSGDRIVGLIIFEGNALAVENGEMISAGVKIGKITPEEIEIIGPDSEIRKYSLEGEKE